MPSAGSLKRKLNRKVINKFGFDVIYKRYNGTSPSLDKYGEPIGGSWTLASGTIKIVIDSDKREVEESLVGGLPEDNNKEVLKFYYSADSEMRIGDKIVYPVSTPNEWIVYYLEPIVFDGVIVINKARCHRDRRY